MITEKEFEILVKGVDLLLDIIGGDEQHPLVKLLDVISNQIIEYEAVHYPPPWEEYPNA